jgi:CrcB protein
MICAMSAHRPAPPPLDPDGPGRRAHARPELIALVFVGGALGTALRYALSRAWPTTAQHWPTGTFVANVVGAFVLGALLEALLRAGPDTGWRQRVRLVAGTGFCGGFTTYSTLAVETDLLLRDHCTGLALGYLLGSVLAGLVAVVLGVAVAARLVRGPERGGARR